MAFENVTLFEVHVDGESFGAFFGEPSSEVEESETYEEASDEVESSIEADDVDAETPRKGRKGRYLAVLGLVAAGSVALRARRRRAAGNVAVDVEHPDEEMDDHVVHEDPVEQ